MSRKLLVLEEVLATLEAVNVPAKYIEAFQKQAEFVVEMKNRKAFDNVTVASGFGQNSQRGFVELTINDTLTQMDAKKAQEVGLMLLQASEAAQSDEIFVKLLKRLGISDGERHSLILLDLREMRQGSRGTVHPS
jgi:hypothetical protein